MSLGIYLHGPAPVFRDKKRWQKNTMGASMFFYEEEEHAENLEKADLAIISVQEVRGAELPFDGESQSDGLGDQVSDDSNSKLSDKLSDELVNNLTSELRRESFSKQPSQLEGDSGIDTSHESSNEVRKEFYQLFNHFPNVNILDLGDIRPGSRVEDTYFAVSKVVEELVKREVIPVIIGGSQDLTYASYKAYEALEQSVNLVTVDPKIDMGVTGDDLNELSYLNHLVMHEPNYLFNLSILGYQSYYTNDELIALVEKLNFDAYRLGHVKSNIEDVEPVLRSADILSFDVNAIAHHAAPQTSLSSPNGLSGEEACRIMRYAGLSDKLSSFGLYNGVSLKDKPCVTAKLLAQMLWYFVDGFNHRAQDYPVASISTYTKYHVAITEEKLDLNFYKSPKTGRWWVKVPYHADSGLKHARHLMMPCAYEDYLKASDGEMPERWWKAYQKLVV